MTRWWKEIDSNPRSPVRESFQPFGELPTDVVSLGPGAKAGIGCRCRAAPRRGGRPVDMMVTGERR